LWSRARPAADVLGCAVVILRSTSELRHMRRWPLVQRRRAPSANMAVSAGSSPQVSRRAPEIRRRPKCWRCTADGPISSKPRDRTSDYRWIGTGGSWSRPVKSKIGERTFHTTIARVGSAVADTPFLQKNSFLPEEFFQPAISAAFGPRIRTCEHPRTGPDWPGRRAAQARWLPADRGPRGRGGARPALFS
jgi:hypothetical protein